MAQCPVCQADLPERARYCPHCGATLKTARSPEQLTLPGTTLGFSAAALAPVGGGSVALPDAGAGTRSLTLRQVLIAVAAVLTVFLAVVLLAQRSRDAGGNVPVLGVIGQPVMVGETALGVAFVGSPERFNGRAAQHGRYLAVAVVIGNRGQRAVRLDGNAFALTDGTRDGTYRPLFVAYGTPEELNAGRYARNISLPPGNAIAAIAVFDISAAMNNPRLLVRDLLGRNRKYTGAIDLTRETGAPSGAGPFVR